MSELGRTVRGIRTETIKTAFVAGMGCTFLFEFIGHVLHLTVLGLDLGDPLQFLTVLIASEVPLWFATVLLWSRGEDIFQAYERKLMRAIRTLERLGFTIEFLEPILDGMKDELAQFDAAGREKLQAMMFAATLEALKTFRVNVNRVDEAKLKLVIARRVRAQMLWEQKDGESP